MSCATAPLSSRSAVITQIAYVAAAALAHSCHCRRCQGAPIHDRHLLRCMSAPARPSTTFCPARNPDVDAFAD